MRRPWDVVPWLCVLKDLQTSEGVEGSQVINMWNGMSAKEHQLNRAIRVGLGLMLQKMPEKVQMQLMVNMSEEGPMASSCRTTP